MPSIKIVAFLVGCTRSLLFCEGIDIRGLPFTDIEDCAARLPAMISVTQRAVGPERVVMGRCRFQLDESIQKPLSTSRVPSG